MWLVHHGLSSCCLCSLGVQIRGDVGPQPVEAPSPIPTLSPFHLETTPMRRPGTTIWAEGLGPPRPRNPLNQAGSCYVTGDPGVGRGKETHPGPWVSGWDWKGATDVQVTLT